MFSSSVQKIKYNILLLKNTLSKIIYPQNKQINNSESINQEDNLENLYQESIITYQGIEKDNNNCERITFIGNNIISDKRYLDNVLVYNNNNESLIIPLNFSRKLFETDIDNYSKTQILELSKGRKYQHEDSCNKKQYHEQLNSFDLFKIQKQEKLERISKNDICVY